LNRREAVGIEDRVAAGAKSSGIELAVMEGSMTMTLDGLVSPTVSRNHPFFATTR